MNIASNNASSGEKGIGIMSSLFGRILNKDKKQSRTIAEQYQRGSRYFDIRVRYVKDVLVLSNGTWRGGDLKGTLEKLAEEMKYGDHVYLAITYDGILPTKETMESFKSEVFRIIHTENQLWMVANGCTVFWLMEINSNPSDLTNIWTTTDKRPRVVCANEEHNENDFILTDYV